MNFRNFEYNFKQNYAFERRQKVYRSIKSKHPDKIPVICGMNHLDFSLTKEKFITPSDCTILDFIHVLRPYLPDMNSTNSIFLFTNNTLLDGNSTMCEIYDKHKDLDGFLYIHCSYENTFG